MTPPTAPTRSPAITTIRLPYLRDSGQINVMAIAMGTAPSTLIIVVAKSPKSLPNCVVQKSEHDRFLSEPENWKMR